MNGPGIAEHELPGASEEVELEDVGFHVDVRTATLKAGRGIIDAWVGGLDGEVIKLGDIAVDLVNAGDGRVVVVEFLEAESAGCAPFVGQSAYGSGDGAAESEAPLMADESGHDVGPEAVGGVVERERDVEVGVVIGEEGDGEAQGAGVEAGPGDVVVLRLLPDGGGRQFDGVGVDLLGPEAHGGQAQQRCCCECEDVDKLFHTTCF